MLVTKIDEGALHCSKGSKDLLLLGIRQGVSDNIPSINIALVEVKLFLLIWTKDVYFFHDCSYIGVHTKILYDCPNTE